MVRTAKPSWDHIVFRHTGFEWGSKKDALDGTRMNYFMEEGVVEPHGPSYASAFAPFGDFDDENRPFEAQIGHPLKNNNKVQDA